MATSHSMDAGDVQYCPSASSLGCYFHLNLVLSEVSSYAQREQEVHGEPATSARQPKVAIEIGQGLQGTIFERLADLHVMKKEKAQNAIMPCNLRHEYSLHQKVHGAFQACDGHMAVNYRVSVPRAYSLIHNTPDLLRICALLPDGFQDPTDVVLMDRVLPLPKTIRRGLIEEFYPFADGITKAERDQVVKHTLDLEANKHCLVRPYLGRSNRKYNRARFSLRNFIMGLDDLKRFEFDVVDLAKALGTAYAIMHWAAHVDGDDVEFVLGSTLVNGPGGNDSNVQHRKISLYLIDFGQCDEIDMKGTTEDVFQAFKGAMVTGDNACFIPNIHRTPQLFDTFLATYSETAKHILSGKRTERPLNIDQFAIEFRDYAEDFH